MLVNRKVWVGISLIAAGGVATASFAAQQGSEAGEGGESAAPAKQAHGSEAGEGGESGKFPGGTFDRALALILAGEGGEGGIGLVKGERTVSAPAIGDAQIKQVVSGNTLRTEYHIAYHFSAAGSAEGWEIQYEKVDPSKCAADKLQNGECWISKKLQLPTSKWSVSNGKLCLSPAVSAITGAGGCAEVYLILNKVALYGSDGKLVGKGSDLYKGSRLEEKISH